MSFGPDVDCIDCLFITLKSKFLSQYQDPDMINWIFPHYSTRIKSGGILNEILKEYEPHVESLYKGITGSALRGEAADDTVYNNTCSTISTISRGRWDWKGKTLWYITPFT